MAKVNSIQIEFHTQSDDKDRDNGVSETLLLGDTIVGSNRSWGRGLVFRNNNIDLGQEFNVREFNIQAEQIGRMSYKVEMDNQQGWHVIFQAIANLDDGTRREVGRKEAKLGDHNGFPNGGWNGGRTTSMPLTAPK